MTQAAPILIAGIGNIFLGDDAFGVEVVQRLLKRPASPELRIMDIGIRGLDLTYALLEEWRAVILIDAVPRRDDPPGTLYILQPDLDSLPAAPPAIEAHSMDPAKVLRAATSMGATLPPVYIVACEPSPLPADDAEAPAELSASVRASLDRAVEMVDSLIEQIKGRSPAPRAGSQQEVLAWPR